MSRVWEHSKAEEGARLVMLALADFSNDDGECWPSIPQLAKKSRLSDRQVQRILRSLEIAGEIEVEHSSGGRHKRSRYWITVQETMTSAIGNYDNGDIGDTNGDIGDTETVTPVSPVVPKTVNTNRHLDPSDKRTRRVESWGAYQNQEGLALALVQECADVFSEEQTRRLVLKALDHSARKKYTHMDLYVGDWVRDDAQKERDRRNRNGQHQGHSQTQSKAAAGDKLLGAWGTPTGQRGPAT